jgi:hypothetical protein
MAITNFLNGLAMDGYTIPAHATITVGAENTNVVPVTIQLYADGDGTEELDNSAAVFMYVADAATGAAITASAPSGGIAIGTDGDYIELVSGSAGYLISEADGDIDLEVTDNSADTFYLVLLLPTGKRIISDVLTFAG